MTRLVRTDSENSDFLTLVSKLDAFLAEIDGKDHSFYAQYNKVDKLNFVVLAYDGELPVACGALKPFDQHSMEVKRMYTLPDFRGNGMASQVLQELESWASEAGYEACVLETGKRQPEAISLYSNKGYQRISNYGQYIGMENSVCFKKMLA